MGDRASSPDSANGNNLQGKRTHENDFPDWSNTCLPRQDYSIVAHSAHQLRVINTHCPENAQLMSSTTPTAEKGVPKYRTPVDPQTSLVYSAFQAQQNVSVMHRQDDAQNLVTAECAELLAAAGVNPTDESSAQPRKYAITVLIANAKVRMDAPTLLDCMAMLARRTNTNGDETRPVQEVRMAILSDKDAATYAEKSGNQTLCSIENNAQLALSYLGVGNERKTIFTTIDYKETAKKTLKTLQKAIAALFTKAELVVPPLLVQAHNLSSDAIENAYKLGMHEANGEFWHHLYKHSEFPNIAYTLSFGEVLDQRVFLKIAPNNVKLNDPHVHFGILLFKENMAQDARTFVSTAMEGEREKHPSWPKDHAFGLRPPLTTKEQACCPHVLSVRGGVVSFRDKLSAFSLRGSPGVRPTQYADAFMPQLVFEIAPFNEEFVNGKFVLPCTQDQTDSTNDNFSKSQWQAAMLGVGLFSEVCGRSPQPGDWTTSGGCGGLNVSDAGIFKAKKLKGSPTKESLALAEMAGTPLSSAFRLGDVLRQVSRTPVPVPVIGAFLTSSIARLGPNASMSEALTACVNLEHDHQLELKKLRDQVHQMEQHQLQNQADPPSATGAAPTAKAEVPPSSHSSALWLQESMKFKQKGGVVIPLPVTKGGVTALITCIHKAKNVNDPTAPAVLRKAVGLVARCSEMKVVQAVGHLAWHLYKEQIFIVFVREHVNAGVDFLKFKTDSSLEDMKVSPMELVDAVRERPETLVFKFCEGPGKLFAMGSC